MKAILSPSLLSADFSKLGQEVKAVAEAGVSWLHLDIMDGSYVPNITFGIPVIKSLRPNSRLFFDVHLMIENPSRYLEAFAIAGADLLVLHLEASAHPQRDLTLIHDLGLKAGVALNPGTDLGVLRWLLPVVDLVLIMGVNPGFSGQKFIPQTMEKVRACRDFLNGLGYCHLPIQVDGGVCETNISRLVEAGSSALVSGSAFFGTKNYARTLQIFNAASDKATEFAAAALQNIQNWRHNPPAKG